MQAILLFLPSPGDKLPGYYALSGEASTERAQEPKISGQVAGAGSYPIFALTWGINCRKMLRGELRTCPRAQECAYTACSHPTKASPARVDQPVWLRLHTARARGGSRRGRRSIAIGFVGVARQLDRRCNLCNLNVTW